MLQGRGISENELLIPTPTCEGQVDLAETDQNGNENECGNENGKGRQYSTFCGIDRGSCK